MTLIGLSLEAASLEAIADLLLLLFGLRRDYYYYYSHCYIAYRYMDWLLTVPLLLMEILLVMKLDPETYSSKVKTLGIGSALMIASGYYGELFITGGSD